MRTTTQSGRSLKRNERNHQAHDQWKQRKQALNHADGPQAVVIRGGKRHLVREK